MSSFGTAVCGCPYGTYLENDDLENVVCKPILENIEGCKDDQVGVILNIFRLLNFD